MASDASIDFKVELCPCADGQEHRTECPIGQAEARGAERERTRLLGTPEFRSFSDAVVLEALHQRKRWPSDHDAGKTDADWFWLIGYLAGKALWNPGDEARAAVSYHTHDDEVTGEPLYFTSTGCPRVGCPERADTSALQKKLHRIITVAGACANWHAQLLGKSDMRPGIEPPKDDTAAMPTERRRDAQGEPRRRRSGRRALPGREDTP